MGFIGRRLLLAALLVGTIGGFASGFSSLHHRHMDRRAAFERHIADVCVEAAERRHKRAADFEQ